jgi:hypothetical protein
MYTGEAVERLGSPGGVKWCGYVFSRTSSGGKLAFLNNIVGVFENEIDDDGNFSEKAWE